MSKADQGKHVRGTDADGAPVISKKRLDPQAERPQLTARKKAFADTMRTADTKVRGMFNEPGSQNRNKH
jgi:hypothetical protein